MGGVDDLFASFFGFGSYAEPPTSIPLRILGLSEIPAKRDAVNAALRARVKQFHPDVIEPNYDSVWVGSADFGEQPSTIQEMLWARDVLLKKIPEPVTDDKGVVVTNISRNGPPVCEKCGRRFHRRCWWCDQQAENARQREDRRLARANRTCAACEITFTPSRSDGLYCTPACRQKSYRARIKETR